MEEQYRTGGVAKSKIPGNKHVDVTKGYRLPHGYKAVKGEDKNKNYSKGKPKVKVTPGWRLPKGYKAVDAAYNMKYEDGGMMAKGGRLTSNEDIIEAFLTSNREAKVGNLSTHYNEYDNQMLLRNYGTLIASRKGNNLNITSIKYSVTTTKITNMVNRMGKDKGLNVKYVEKFEDGGNMNDCYCYEIGGL